MTVTFTSGTTRYSLITRPTGLMRGEPVILPDPSCKPKWTGMDAKEHEDYVKKQRRRFKR